MAVPQRFGYAVVRLNRSFSLSMPAIRADTLAPTATVDAPISRPSWPSTRTNAPNGTTLVTRPSTRSPTLWRARNSCQLSGGMRSPPSSAVSAWRDAEVAGLGPVRRSRSGRVAHLCRAHGPPGGHAGNASKDRPPQEGRSAHSTVATTAAPDPYHRPAARASPRSPPRDSARCPGNATGQVRQQVLDP